MFELPPADLAALIWFFALWLGYTLAAERGAWQGRSLSATVNAHRLIWMRQLTERENRISDAALMGLLMNSVSFLASATILIVGGMIAALGAGEGTYSLLQELPFARKMSRELYDIKMLLLTGVFVYAFFKFTWALRQFNYGCILIGGAPAQAAPETDKTTFAKRASRVTELAALSFNRGLRAYYFGLAAATWFVHPYLFAAASLAVIAILYRREFRSRTLKALRD